MIKIINSELIIVNIIIIKLFIKLSIELVIIVIE